LTSNNPRRETPVTVLALNDLTVIRDVRTAPMLRAADGDSEREGLGLMEVRFSPFNTWYRIDSIWEGTFLERTVPGAFKRTFNSYRSAGLSGFKTLFNHGGDLYIGDKLLGDAESLNEESDSPVSLVRLWDVSYNRDLLPGIRSGAYRSSFMFLTIRDEWNEEPEKSDHNPDGIPERTLREVRVLEAGPVTWPANPAASTGMRCLSGTDAYYEALQRRDPSRVAQLTALRGNGPALRTPCHPGPAPVPPVDPAPRHSMGLTAAQRRERLLKR
jgi:phage head maturation protease